jgi:2,5-diketo-D-gluconate reductase B
MFSLLTAMALRIAARRRPCTTEVAQTTDGGRRSRPRACGYVRCVTHATDPQTITVQGVEVPSIGFGTWQVTGRDAEEGVADALATGYRHIDSARIYGNEVEVGRGIAASGVDRDRIFLTTKLWTNEFTRDAAIAATEDSLRNLGTDYVDLLLMHWPNPEVPIGETIGALNEVRERGLVRNFGVSNFPSRLVAEALEHGPVLANQVEYHPYLVQPPIIEQAREHDLLLEAYSPFAHGDLLDDPVLAEIGEQHGKSVGQVALRWLLDQPQVIALPKASSHDRRAQNLDVFDFSLSDADRARIEALAARRHRTGDPSFGPDWDD